MSKWGKLLLVLMMVGLLGVGFFLALPAVAQGLGAKGAAYAAQAPQGSVGKPAVGPAVGFWGRGLGHKFGFRFGPLQDLQGVPPEQRFSHFLGGQFSYTDATGQKHTIYTTPGTVTAVSSNSLTITVNGTNESRTFNITANTVIGARPPKGSIQAINQGDQVVVVTKDDSSDALAVKKVGPLPPRKTSPTATPTP
jgi:hypothetical protein